MQGEDGHPSPDTSMDKHTMAEAAKRLGVTKDAIRKRVQRGNIPYDKDENGVIYVYLDREAAGPRTGGQTSADTARDEAMEILRDQVTFLRAELERKDALLLNMTEGLKALQAPSEPRDAPVTATEKPVSGTAHPEQEEPERRPWWARLFGG